MAQDPDPKDEKKFNLAHALDWLRVISKSSPMYVALFIFVMGHPAVQNYLKDLVGVSALSQITEDLVSTLQRNTNALEALTDRVSALEEASKIDQSPAMTFEDYGHIVTDAPIGGEIQVQWTYRKHRSCGRPVVQLFLQDSEGLQVQLTDISILGEDNRGIASPVSETPYTIRYSARVPDYSFLSEGRAYVWASVGPYEGRCSDVPIQVSPKIPMRLLGDD